MDLISKLRLMMAEQNFFEVQNLIEVHFNLNNETQHELLVIYYEVLKAQNKKISTDYLLEIANFECSNGNYDLALNLIGDISPELESSYYIKIYNIKINIAASTGKINELYNLLSSFLLFQYANKKPFIPSWISTSIKKYFKDDFNLKINQLALKILVQDIKSAEALTTELIISCFEKPNQKNVVEKLIYLGEILKTNKIKSVLDIYQNFCFIYANDSQKSVDFKKIIEMCIFFDDFKFQVVFLNLLDRLGYINVAKDSSEYIQLNENYNYVYLDKFFNQLKKYFLAPVAMKESEKNVINKLELTMSSNRPSVFFYDDVELSPFQDEDNLIHLLRYQTYSPEQLCDLTVCFLQAELPRTALSVSEMILGKSDNSADYLKGSYLKISALLMLKDYRAVIDVSLQAMEKANSQNDILSFMYAQGEVYLRIKDYNNAKKILGKIISIDPGYRMAKERLEKINEI